MTKLQTDESLAEQAQGGDRIAFDDLARRYDSVVRLEAGGVNLVPGVDREDLRQCCRLALVNAIRSYQAGRGTTFESYAKTCMRREMYKPLQKAARKVKSLKETVLTDMVEERGEWDEGFEHVIDKPSDADKDQMLRLVWGLKPQHKKVYHRLYVLGQEPEEAARSLGLALTKLNQLHKRVLDQLKAGAAA